MVVESMDVVFQLLSIFLAENEDTGGVLEI